MDSGELVLLLQNVFYVPGLNGLVEYNIWIVCLSVICPDYIKCITNTKMAIQKPNLGCEFTQGFLTLH